MIRQVNVIITDKKVTVENLKFPFIKKLELLFFPWRTTTLILNGTTVID